MAPVPDFPPAASAVNASIAAKYPDTAPPDVSEDDMVDQALYVSVSVVQQALSFLDESQLTAEQLAYPSKLIPGGSIGKHLRHAADHYNLLLKSLSSPAPHTLSYDVRERNTIVETSPAGAVDALTRIVEGLKESVMGTPLDEPITLHAVTPFPAVMGTTFARELWFVSLHAIHHWSMVRVVAGEQNIPVDDSFGVAPSTLLFRGRSGTKL